MVWLTGLPGAGKSTVAYACEKALMASGHLSYVLDGDNLRHGLSSDLGFEAGDRAENVRRAAEAAAILADAGLITFAALVSPSRAERGKARQRIGAERFIEVHVDAPRDECERRDPKGLYARARRGEIAGFTGISAPYEAPEAPEIHLGPGVVPLAEAVKHVLEVLRGRGHLTRGVSS